MHKRKYACNRAAALGDQIVGFETENIAENAAPAEAVEKSGIGGCEHEGVPGWRIFGARADGP